MSMLHAGCRLAQVSVEHAVDRELVRLRQAASMGRVAEIDLEMMAWTPDLAVQRLTRELGLELRAAVREHETSVAAVESVDGELAMLGAA